MEWIEVKNQSDVDGLMKAYGGFHDSCITGLRYETGNYVNDSLAMGWGTEEQFRLVMSIQRQGTPRDLELCFTGLRRISLNGYSTRFFVMLDCYLSFYGPYIVWADGEGFDPERPVRDGLVLAPNDMYTFIVADGLKWRFI